MKIRVKYVVLAIVAVLAAAATLIVIQIGPRNIMGLLLYDQRREVSLNVGHPAPDVMLQTLDGMPVQLAGMFRDRPTVLIFGSFT